MTRDERIAVGINAVGRWSWRKTRGRVLHTCVLCVCACASVYFELLEKRITEVSRQN